MKGFVPTPTETVDQMVEKLFKERQPLPNDQILDPGCGEGAFIEGIIRWCNTHNVRIPKITGIDSDPKRVYVAKRKLKGFTSVTIQQRDFLKQSPTPSYHFIIGNPPYVAITGLSEIERDEYRQSFRTAHGRFDLYMLFFEQCLKHLLPNGRLVFITPEKFTYVDAAKPLRTLLGNLQIESIELAREDTFPNFVTYPAIIVLRNVCYKFPRLSISPLKFPERLSWLSHAAFFV